MREFPHSISALIDQRSAVSFGSPAASSPAPSIEETIMGTDLKVSVGWTPRSAVDALVGLCGMRHDIPNRRKKPARGPAADLGVRPTKGTHNSTFRMAPLKNELQGELDDPAFAGRADFPKCIWRVDIDPGIAEVRTVDDIEELTAKLQALSLGEAELLAHADVGIHRTRSTQLRIRTRRAAELSRQIRRLRRCIEVARDQVRARPAGVEYGAPQTVGTRSEEHH